MNSSPSKAWVRATRERVGLSQKALADKLATMFGTTQDGVQQAIDDLASKAASGEYYGNNEEFLNVKVDKE